MTGGTQKTGHPTLDSSLARVEIQCLGVIEKNVLKYTLT